MALHINQLTKDTSIAIHHTSNGIVDLTKHLLQTSHTYVCPGKFSSDFLEKEFSKLRQGFGGTHLSQYNKLLKNITSAKHHFFRNLMLKLTSLMLNPGTSVLLVII